MNDPRESPRDAAPRSSREGRAEKIGGQYTQELHRNTIHEPTDYRRPQRVIPLDRSFRTIAPVGTGERLDPTSLDSCHENNNENLLETVGGAAKGIHQLYPIVEMPTGVPLGMCNSVYTFPELPTIGFVSGRTSSCMGARKISREIGLILRISYARIE